MFVESQNGQQHELCLLGPEAGKLPSICSDAFSGGLAALAVLAPHPNLDPTSNPLEPAFLKQM